MAHCGVPAENEEFCDEFFPLQNLTTVKRKELTTNPFSELAGAEKDRLLEQAVADAFIAAVNDNDLAPGLKVAQCGTRPDPVVIDPEKQKIDAAFYREHLAPTDGRPHWGDQLVAVEFKRDETAKDPFDDNKENISTNTDSRKKVRGQIITYAELIFAVQQRVALFMLVVIGRKCRFIRWDRSGTIVTRALDYVERWEFFCDILWQMSQCSDVQLGLDPTATHLFPGDRDYNRMTDAAIENDSDVDHRERKLKPGEVPADGFVFKYVRTMFKKSLTPEWPRYKLEVPSGDTVRTFLVCKPVFRATGMAGRGTRGYVALDCATGRFVWLKDAWRAHYLLVEREGDILAVLNATGVQNVPTVICHGDIQNQTTKTPDWWERKNPTISAVLVPLPLSLPSAQPVASSSHTLPVPPVASSSRTLNDPSSSGIHKRKRDDENTESRVPPPKGIETDSVSFREDCPLRLHQHYRLVEKEVALPLNQFENGRQLVSIVSDCVFAHYKAATKRKARLLHRDISGGNILILPKIIAIKGGFKLKWSGLLADWEMSKPIREKSDTRRPRQPERTGTWQYMSVALLEGPKLVEISDELEAFLYVLIYYAVRYLSSNIKDTTVADFIDGFFDTYGVVDDQYVCGHQKLFVITVGELAITDTKKIVFSSPMDQLLKTLLSWFKSHRIVTIHQNAQAKLSSKVWDALDEINDDELDQPEGHLPGNDFDSSDSDSGSDSDSDSDSEIDDAAAQGPSKMDRKHWKYLRSHKRMRKLLNRYITKATWGRNDKVGDRVPADYKPRAKPEGPSVPASFASNKKPRIERVEGIETLPVLQPREPVTPVKPRPMAQSTRTGRYTRG